MKHFMRGKYLNIVQQRRVFTLTSLAIALSTASAWSWAQDTIEEGQSSSGSQLQTTAVDEVIQLETVVVTARRRAEAEQNVPAPITVIKGKQLEEAKIYQVQDLQQQLPNFTSQFIHARQSSVAVRGIGNNTANEGLEGSVGIYLDNVYLGRPGQAVFDLLDIEQVDLLRGPQGTLFGKNTTAGVLNITSKQPVFYQEGNVEISAGERGYKQLKGTWNQPLSDAVAVRLSGYGTHDDGWLENTYNGKDLNEIDRYGLRGQLLFQPSDELSLRVIAEHNREDSSTGSLVPYSFAPWNPTGSPASYLPVGVTGSNATTFADRATWLGAKNIARNPYDYKVDFDAEQQAKIDQSAVSAELNWQLNGYKLTSITAWRDWNFSPKNDLDFSRLAGITGGFKVEQDQFSQEIRLASPTGGAVDYVVGAYYFYQNIDSRNTYQTGGSALALTTAYPNNAELEGLGKAKTHSYAAFGQSTWHVNDQFDLTTGLRYTSEKKTGEVNQSEINPAVHAVISPLFQSYHSGELSHRDNSIAGLVTASYQFNPNILGFATYSTGEKSGGFNINSVATPAAILGNDSLKIEPEKAQNFELGLKTSWLDNRIYANINAFITKLKDYQAVTNTAIGNQYIGLLTNVGDLTSKGIEVDFKAQATRNLSLNFNAAYTDATFDNGTAPTPFEVFNGPGGTNDSGYGKGYRDIKGNRVNGAPRWTANVTLQHQHDVLANSKHYSLINYGWRSETYADVNNSEYSKIPSYGVLNLTTGLRIPHGDNEIDLSLWAKNALDKHYFLGLVNSGNGMYAGSAAQPRTIGASLRYNF
ncbi:TonB-dependent receptor [Acinetobacter puyangensis]|uniref:Iron complex outermembrane recepter protein n=1 Tax=Acinetobacter puyangensis TaxID=1096779 RepID=A0A240EDG0_9GAMM|nr:TonB-dependent receptor [Acinetobacter puyangensis]SNX45940.1 iron complex outermembrane recepter protein [Acinetobacter puyangensis]